MSPPDGDPNARFSLQEIIDWDHTSFQVTRTPEGLRISGKCPRCTHDVDKELPRIGILGFEQSFDDDPEDAIIRCNCLHTHEGGEAGKGCGGYWGAALVSE